MIRIPDSTFYIKDDWWIENFPKQARVLRMQDVENAYSKALGFLPLLIRAFPGFWRQQVIGNFRWNTRRFQLRTSGVQYGLRGLETADQGI
jgi:hypothetical protein